MWGCSHELVSIKTVCDVFPTYVGMFLVLSNILFCMVCLPHACGVFPKSKNFYFLLESRKCLLYKCFHRTDTCRFSFKSFVCLCRPSSSVLGRVWELWVARHISALFVNLTFHLRRNHHVRRICSRP